MCSYRLLLVYQWTQMLPVSSFMHATLKLPSTYAYAMLYELLHKDGIISLIRPKRNNDMNTVFSNCSLYRGKHL